MDETQIAEWNKVVKPGDEVWHLGDFTLGTNAQEYLIRLNGYVNFVIPTFHHDRKWYWDCLRVQEKRGFPYQTVNGDITFYPPIELITPFIGEAHVPITLSHFPLAHWPREHYGGWCLHSHSHSNYQGTGKILDVGVDNVNKIWGAYRPVSLEEVAEHMKSREG